jgi:lysophospholipase L1-like esterase
VNRGNLLIMVKPYKIFFLLLLLLFLISLPSFFFPKDGIQIFGFTLNYPSFSQFIDADTSQNQLNLKPEIALLDKIIDSTLTSSQPKVLQNSAIASDTLTIRDSTKLVDSISEPAFNPDWLKSKITKLEFPDSLHQSLTDFFESLRLGDYNRKFIRVLHYGDSQIEGDRVTSYLRSRLQAKFGGGGIGFVHAVPQSSQPAAITQSNSSNWEKITLADHDKDLSGINRYGALGGYSMYNQNRNFFSKSTFEAWIHFQRNLGLNSPSRNFQKVKVFYGFNANPFMVELNAEGKAIDAELIPTTNNLNAVSFDIDTRINSFEIKFKGENSPLIFGISLETEKGIGVDNIPIRGSSGNNFTKTDMVFMKEMLKMLNAKLIILQFGVNVVPNVVESYKYYEIQLYNQLKAIQNAKPDASIVMIGVSDVSRKEGLHYVSYPNIEKIRDAQKNAAFRAGVPFWDCYTAMGGRNSMAAWENAKPPLASKDFVHFTYRGANLIAEMFYAALMSEYSNYLSKYSNPKRLQTVMLKDSLKKPI